MGAAELRTAEAVDLDQVAALDDSSTTGTVRRRLVIRQVTVAPGHRGAAPVGRWWSTAASTASWTRGWRRRRWTCPSRARDPWQQV
ncbi:hypothetical protein ACQPYE_35555 [Actinosynnema sp. CA-299493]